MISTAAMTSPGGFVAGHDGHDPEADVHDHGLDDVEQGQRAVGLERRPRVVAQRHVVGPRRPRLGPERLDRLVVEQGVDRDPRRLGVGGVHLAPVLDPPVRQGEGRDGVDGHHGHGQRPEAPVVLAGQNPCRQHQLDPGRNQVEGEDAQQEVHRP
jgi:hypothetical protein